MGSATKNLRALAGAFRALRHGRYRRICSENGSELVSQESFQDGLEALFYGLSSVNGAGGRTRTDTPYGTRF